MHFEQICYQYTWNINHWNVGLKKRSLVENVYIFQIGKSAVFCVCVYIISSSYLLTMMVSAKQKSSRWCSCCHSLMHVNGVALHWHAVLSGVSWDANPSPHSLWGTNLRGGTMYFVACQKQSLPAHYIYIMSCSCNALNSEERNHTRVFNNH